MGRMVWSLESVVELKMETSWMSTVERTRMNRNSNGLGEHSSETALGEGFAAKRNPAPSEWLYLGGSRRWRAADDPAVSVFRPGGIRGG